MSTESGQPEGQGHPAWKEILDVLPESLHEVVKPTLAKWDKGVSDRFDQINSQYSPYKEFVENKIDPEILKRGFFLLREFETNPEALVQNAIDSLDLDFVAKSEIPDASDDDNYEYGEDEYDGMKLEQHPQFKEAMDTLAKIQEWQNSQLEEKRVAEQNQSFEQQLDALKEAHGDFNRLAVTALMAQGVDGEEAVKLWKDGVNQAAAEQLAAQNPGSGTNTNQPPPVVMGGDGTTGSGIPSEGVDLGSMGKSSLNDLVVQMLENLPKD